MSSPTAPMSITVPNILHFYFLNVPMNSHSTNRRLFGSPLSLQCLTPTIQMQDPHRRRLIGRGWLRLLLLVASHLLSVTLSHQEWIINNDLPLFDSTQLSLEELHHPAHRRLAAASPLTLFRAVNQRGLRGFLEGGQFTPSTADECAQRCVNDPFCLSFDLETSTQTCYVSYSDRFAHPEAFLTFPTGMYYEWQGVVSAPELEPNGGRFSTQIAVRLLTQKLGATIHYLIVNASASVVPTASDLVGTNKQYAVALSGDVVIVPPYACRIYAVAVKDGMQDSPLVVSNDYRIYATKYLYLVPLFNGAYHGNVARIQLDIRGKKRPRPARFLEFSDYETTMGIGPYTTQVTLIDMAKLHPSFTGFQGGFTAFSKTAFLNETYLTPSKDDKNYMVTAWQVVLEEQYVAHPQRTGTPTRIFQDAEYLYLTPYYNGAAYVGHIIRVLTMTYDWPTPVIQQLNLTQIDASLKGFSASFTDDSQYAYFIPKENESGLHGKLVRLDLANFAAAGITVLDLKVINPRYVGFSFGFKYKNYAYLVPFRRPLVGDELTTNLREFPVTNSGVVVRVDLTTFATADSIDLAAVHPRLAGFSGSVRVTHYAYFVPFMRVKEPASVEVNPYSGMVARLDLRDFKTVQYLDLSLLDGDLRGFVRGIAYKQYVILVPHRAHYNRAGDQVHTGKVVRIDTNDFTLKGVSVLDLPTASRSQVPNVPDDDLRGFNGGVVSGKYAFFVPYFNGKMFSGKVCRINLDKFDEVQTLDLTQLSASLRGFSGAVLSKAEETLETDLFGEFEIRPGTTTPYKYVY